MYLSRFALGKVEGREVHVHSLGPSVARGIAGPVAIVPVDRGAEVEWITSLMPSFGCACCCLAVFLVLLVAGALAFRPKKPRAEDVEGIAPSPERGHVTHARLTNMGFDDPPAKLVSPADEAVQVRKAPPIPGVSKSVVPGTEGAPNARVVTAKPTAIPSPPPFVDPKKGD